MPQPARQVIVLRYPGGPLIRALAPKGDYPKVDADFDENSMAVGDAVFYQGGLPRERVDTMLKTGKFMAREHDGGVTIWRYERIE